MTSTGACVDVCVEWRVPARWVLVDNWTSIEGFAYLPPSFVDKLPLG